MGPALERKALAFIQLGHFPCIGPRIAAGEARAQVPGRTLESRTSRASVVIWSMEKRGRGRMRSSSIAWPGYLDMVGAESKGSTCPRPGFWIREAWLGHLAHCSPTVTRLVFWGWLCCMAVTPPTTTLGSHSQPLNPAGSMR